MNLLLLALAVIFDAAAFFVVGTSYGTSQWPPPHDITPFWAPQLIASCVAVLFSGVYLWRYLRAQRSRPKYSFAVLPGVFAFACLVFALYYPIHFRHVAADQGAIIRADLARFTRQQQP